MAFDRRRLLLFVLVALLAVVAGFVTFPPEQAPLVVLYAGPWVMLATVVIFVAALVQIGRQSWSHFTEAAQVRQHWGDAAVVVVCGVILLVHEPREFKILADELVLLGTSYDLHFNREFLVPLRAHDVAGNLVQIGGIIDKRPFFFAFTLSLIHDLTGYRPGNIFVLNGIVSFVALAFACVLGRRLGGRWGGILAALLLTAIPMTAQNATGGGFELFNLMMILGVMLLAVRYHRQQDDAALNAFVLGTVLLAQTRYESVLFVLPAGCLIAGVWWKQRRMQLTWPMLLAPLLLCMYPLQNKVFQKNPSFWQLPEGVKRPFGPEFVFDNIGHAANFLFGVAADQPNSPAVAGLGLLAIVFLILFALRKRAAVCRQRPEVLVLLSFGAVILGNLALLMCYHWGQLDHFEVWRLSLPLHLLMILAIVTVLRDFSAHRLVPPFACGFAAFLIYAQAIPSAANAAATKTALVTNETAWEAEFLRTHHSEEMLYICNSPLLPIVHQVPGVSLAAANQDPQRIAYHLRMRTYAKIYAFQRLDINVDTAVPIPVKSFELDPAFETEVVAERSFFPFSLSRIVRIVAVKPPAAPACTNPGIPAAATSAPIAPERRDPLKEFFDALP